MPDIHHTHFRSSLGHPDGALIGRHAGLDVAARPHAQRGRHGVEVLQADVDRPLDLADMLEKLFKPN